MHRKRAVQLHGQRCKLSLFFSPPEF